MRTAFIEALLQEAAADDRVFLVTGDIGFGVVEPFIERFPQRYVNVGVAEQNMIGVATGLALSGRVVFVYSIANFPLVRCLEQIRNDICYHEADVKIVAVGGGFAYGVLGYSHHAVEDLSFARALPNLAVCAPGDTYEAFRATQAVARHPGPCYLRLGRAGELRCHPDDAPFELGRALQLRAGGDVALVTTGAILPVALEAAEELAGEGIEASVTSLHTLRPLDVGALRALAVSPGRVVTIEEHTVNGGLGTVVAEVLADEDLPCRLRRIALPDRIQTQIGDQEHLRALCGLTPAAIAAGVTTFLDR